MLNFNLNRLHAYKMKSINYNEENVRNKRKQVFKTF